MKQINLLPKSEQKLLHQEKIYASVKTFMFWSFFMYIVVAIVLVGGKYYVQYAANNLDTEIAQQKSIISKQDNVNLKKEIDNDNAIITDYNLLGKNVTTWSETLKIFSDIVPPEIYLTSFSSNSKTGKIDIVGVGGTRESVLLLRDNIIASSEFKDIDLPFENLQKSINVPFHYTFYLADVKPQAEPPAPKEKKKNDTSK
jgi:hypothetical protein